MSDKKYKGPLPKSKPNKLERLLNKRVKGEKGPYKPKIGDLNEMGPIVTDTKTGEIVSGFNEGGKVISNADARRFKRMKMPPSSILSESGKSISDADRARIQEMLGAKKTDRQMMQYEDGGEVRGMGRAYQGKKRGCKIR